MFYLFLQGLYFQQIGSDYANTFRDTLKQIQEKPLRFIGTVTTMCAASAVYISCPHEYDYRAALLSASIDLWETPACLQSRRSLAHIEERITALFHGHLRYCSILGLVHFIWRDDRTDGCRLYSEICPYTNASSGSASGSQNGPFRSFLRLFLYDTPPDKNVDEVGFADRAKHIFSTRIVDVGALGRFWVLDSAMLDYDINEEEFSEAAELKPSETSERLEDASEQTSHASTSSVPAQEEVIEDIDSQETIENSSELCKPEGGEDEWEVVNETLVYADCVGAVESELMEPGKSVLLVDLDAESPLIQIGPAIFQGTYEECLGTNLIFERHQPTPENNQASMNAAAKPSIEIFASRTKNSVRPYFNYFGKTSKNLNLQRVFLKPKE
ncbi:unnamed protein product [Taenia asiatica]|uniref:Transcription factor TFIIIC triple barrel domain-containing protein n=1 Tax=Taenia asiatica TaxID=60517 RepID=A0A3P6QU06_TAEAS|nr:unnamed protein product [Taenia asiatica]